MKPAQSFKSVSIETNLMEFLSHALHTPKVPRKIHSGSFLFVASLMLLLHHLD